MKTIYVKFWYPTEVFPDDIIPELSDREIKETCFRCYEYPSEAEALMAYANTMCSWSTLLDTKDDITEFINDAYDHIKSNDIEWLEANFT